MSKETVKVTDNRERGYFQVDNEIMDDYGLDEIAFYLYSKVCRHAFNNKNCYFSLAKLKKKLKWGNSTVSKALNTLKKKKLISTERVEGKGYRFFLLSVKKKTLPQPGKVGGNPSLNGKTPSSQRSTTLPPRGNKEDLTKQDPIKKTKNAVDKSPAPFQILGEKWCEFIKLDIKQLTNKDWKAIYQHDKKGADIDQLKALSGAAWKEKKHDLTYLYGIRASLLPKIKPKGEKTFYTPEELFGEEKK